MVVRRGEVWWASLNYPRASEPGLRRPVIIIQSNEFNKSKINTCIAIVITSNIRLAEAPGNIYLPKKSTNLPKDSVANVSQIITIDKSFLSERVGKLNQKLLSKLSEGLKLVLEL